MVGLDDHLKDPLYANWVRNTFALNIVNSVLQPYVYGEVVKLHKSIISRCPAGVTCGSCSWEQVPRCPNNFCNFIKDEIRKNHRYTDPSFDNTNASDWKSDAWEIAKCFMPKGYKECTSSSADFSATVNIVMNCKAFDALVLCNLDSPRNIFSKARILRNDLMHSNKLKVPEYDFQSNLDLLMRILNDIKNKPTNFTEALDKITELKAGRLKITLEDVLDARTQFLLENGATKEFVNEKIANLEQGIKEGASIWKVSQHRLIDNFVEGSKYALVKIMEGHMDKVKPERCPKQKWNFSKFLDGIESHPEIILLHQRHRLKLYPDDGVTADIHDLDLFLLCHILSIESTVLLDNNLKDYIRELIRIRDQILGNSPNIAVTDLEELAECLEEPLRTEILQIYHREGIIDDALKLQFELTSWQQNEDTMENKQISNKALQEIQKQATRIDELEKKVDLLLQQNENKTEIRRNLEGHDRGIETNVQVKPKHCDKKEEEQVQYNMTSKDEAKNIFLANGGRNDFCEKLHVKTAQPIEGSIILKVTCESIKDLVRFWHSCTDGNALRALSKVRDDYRKFLGCQTLDFDIILTKKEVNRCMEYLIDRLSSRISDISVLENVPGTPTLVETVPVAAEDASKEKLDIVTEESDRDSLDEEAKKIAAEQEQLKKLVQENPERERKKMEELKKKELENLEKKMKENIEREKRKTQEEQKEKKEEYRRLEKEGLRKEAELDEEAKKIAAEQEQLKKLVQENPEKERKKMEELKKKELENFEKKMKENIEREKRKTQEEQKKKKEEYRRLEKEGLRKEAERERFLFK